ncbi:diguanylate cyclase [Longimicrobium sp.]|uniref:GGDEF domain-containing protein n=1 Tax=Longimicrobium sp. TaxID=2029185 RepID=UPI002B913D6C|nr:diguanylate cyclase [Longimicrobium sp.]HSU13908.1 diguanylate cyclase [Longimicrobium sp.]
MIRRLFLILVPLALLGLPAPAPAQGRGKPIVLSTGWKVSRGDQPQWARPGFDDRAWTTAAVPGEWENVFPGYDGFGWYRRQVTLPADLHGEPVGVLFATVGDAFEVYWDGVKIGARGEFPPHFTESVNPSLFLVPDSLLRTSGSRHLLAVRIYNDYAYGGLMGSVRMGRFDVLADKRSPRDMVIGTLVAFFLAIGIYHLAFWVRRRAARENLWFATVSLAISIYGATFSGTISEMVLPFTNPYRLGLVALLAGGPFFVALVYSLFDLRVRRREQLVCAAFVALAAVSAVMPLGPLAQLNRWIDVALAVGMLAIVLRAFRAASRHRPHARLLVFGTAAFAATFVYDLASEYDFVPVAHVLPSVPSLFWIGFLVFVMAVGIATAGKWALTEVTALVDPLTELARRHVLEDAMRRETERIRRSGGTMALVLIDLDFFKQVNDAYGHRTGDDVLARVGRLLRSTARNIDLPARFGGEEFAVLLYDSDFDGALAFAERFRANLREMSVAASGGRTVRVTASLGVAVGSELVDPAALVEAADQALYRAKNQGRDRLIGIQLQAGTIPEPARSGEG